jgi:DNA-binding response OmpR family regulator
VFENLEREDIALALLDLMLPGMSGEELEIDFESRSVRKEGQTVTLTPNEFELILRELSGDILSKISQKRSTQKC